MACLLWITLINASKEQLVSVRLCGVEGVVFLCGCGGEKKIGVDRMVVTRWFFYVRERPHVRGLTPGRVNPEAFLGHCNRRVAGNSGGGGQVEFSFCA
eukprot:scaffold14748_cov87-Skeletonema_menzelii.AAC.1